MLKRASLIWLVVAGLAVLRPSGVLTEVSTAVGNPPRGVDPHRVMRLLADGRADSAVAVLDSAATGNADDPLILVLRARCLRDGLIDEDNDKSLISDQAEPIHAILDRAIDACDRVLDRDATNTRYLYYRGRAYMGKAELNALTRHYWGAGRSAGKAKRDLEDFLELAPGDTDASGDLGVFLYFADALPGVVKLISKILFFPTGHRERGMDLLRYAVSRGDGIFAMDHEIAVAAAYILFEGRLDEGADVMIDLLDRYPYYTRLAEPLGVLAPLQPLRIREFQRVEDTSLAHHLARHGQSPDWSLVKRMQLHRSYNDIYFSSPQRALFALTTLARNPVERPDWVRPLVLLNQGTLYAMSGRIEDAEGAFAAVREGRSVANLKDIAKSLVDALDDAPQPIAITDMDFIGLIYDGAFDRARTGLDAYHQRHGADIAYHFYRGELGLLRQDFVTAAAAYEEARRMRRGRLYETYNMLATIRLAEIHGHEGRYEVAEKLLDDALEFTFANYLLGYTVKSRQRYYRLLRDGTLDETPRLLLGRRSLR